MQAITHRLVYFNPLPPHGGRHAGKYVALDIVLFQSTPSAWRETINNENSKYSSSFQSTPSAWRETVSEKAAGISHRFQSTPSAWRETIQTYTALPTDEFQSTPSAWRETDSASRIFSPSSHFNPLPPHGGRQNDSGYTLVPNEFQSTPSAWRETIYDRIVGSKSTFQSTPSAWRETWRTTRPSLTRLYFNPLPPHGGRLMSVQKL